MSKRLMQQDGTTIVASKPNVGHTLAVGQTPPADGAIGYAPNCLFIDENASPGAGWYRNDGTRDSADFNAVGSGTETALATTAGAAITGSAETFRAAVSKVGSIFVTRIIIDLTGLDAIATDLDIIGKSTNPAHLGQVTAARNGTIFGGLVTCLELPAGASTDIDLYSAAEATGILDGLVTDLTETALVTAGGAWANGTQKGLTAVPAAGEYLYLTNGAAANAGTYTAGKFLIELYGY
jgi:hypothetical protein